MGWLDRASSNLWNKFSRYYRNTNSVLSRVKPRLSRLLTFNLNFSLWPRFLYECVLPEKNPYPSPPHGRSLEIPRGKGVLKAKLLEAKYGAKLEFLGEGGAKQKPSVGGVRIFSGTTQYELIQYEHDITLQIFVSIL